jgi:CheY-like chemotaxis protein
LRERAGFDESAVRQLDLTHRQARRAARIVQNLLEFSRPAAPQKKPLDVNSLIERTLQLHEHSLRRNNVEVEFHLQPGLQPVVGDGNQLIQVFLNLITNAEHAIREVRESGRIQIRLGQIGGYVSVTVQDDGIGIQPENLPRIFDPFYTTKRPGGGTGLGLSICMSIVREHGGSIDVETLPAGGSAFTVFLPVVATAAGERSPFDTPVLGTKIESVGTPQDILKGRSVLVLDDEESLRMLLEEGLSVHGLRVDCAATPAEALALVSRRAYDIFLCDLNLTAAGQPADGRKVTQQILAAARANQPSVIFMTGELIEPGDSSASGPRRLQKPFRISEVVALLREILAPAVSPVEKI